jgi:hypothetical protein
MVAHVIVLLAVNDPLEPGAKARNTYAVLHNRGLPEQGLDTAQLSYKLSSPIVTVTLCPGRRLYPGQARHDTIPLKLALQKLEAAALGISEEPGHWFPKAT